MSSANIRLAARGEQDLCLTGTPKQTYFLALYKQREPYVLETYEVPFDTTIVPYGTTATCTVPAKGDLMHKVTLKCTLPALFYRKTGWCYPVTSTTFQPFIYLFDSAGNVIDLLQVRSNQAFYSAAVRTWVPVSQNLTSVGYDGTRLTYTTSATVARIGFLATDASFFGFDANLGTKFGLSGIVTYAASTAGLAAPFTLEQSGWVPGFVPPSGLSYVDSVGTYLVRTAELLVGGQTIDVVTGEYIDLRQDLEVQYENQAALLLLNGKGDTSTIQLARTYYITLPFTPEMDLPIRDLYRQDVRVNVSFEQFSRLTSTDVPLSGYGFSNAASCTVITVPNPTLFSNTACYDGTYIYAFSYNMVTFFNPETTFALSSFINVGDAGANSITEASFVLNGKVYAVTTDQYIVTFPVVGNTTFLTTSYTVFPVGLTRRAACSDGRYIYAYAGNNAQAAGTNIVYKFDTQSLTVESYNMTGVTISAVVLTNVNLQTVPAFDGKYVYFTDKYQSTYILRYDTSASFTTVGSWALINYSSLLSVAQQNYLATIFDGRYMYWITDTQQSTNAVTWLRYDTTLTFTSAGSWQTFVITGVSGVTTAAQFRSPIFDGQYIYVSSSSSLPIFLRYDTTKAFNAAGSYDWFNYTTGSKSGGGAATAIQIGGTNTFNVNVFDGRYIYSLPLGTSNVLRQDTSTVIAPTSLQASLIVDYVSGPNKTEIKPQEFILSQTSLTQSADPTFRLEIQAPVKEAFIVNQTPASASGPYAYNALTNVELRFNDEKVFDWTTRTIEPYMYHSTMPQRTVALVSFSQDPEANNKVAGSVNLARIRDIQMTVPRAANTFTRVYTRSYNVLRVENGIGGLKFMSPTFGTMYQPNSRWLYTSNVITTAAMSLPLSGNALSATQIGGIGAGTGPGTGTSTTPTTIPVQKIVADVNGNIHITGTYRGNQIQFGQGDIQPWYGGTPDSFFAMYSSAGVLVHIGLITGYPGVASSTISGIAVQGSSAYITGYYSGAATAIYGNNAGIALAAPATGATNMFLAKFNVTTSGYYLLWATYGASATASSACTGLAIAADSEGCYITGNCGPTAAAFTFYNADTTNATNATLTATVGTRDGFLVKFNTIGTPQWAARMAVASSTVNSTGIACSPDAGVVVVGSWTGATALNVYSSGVSSVASLTSSTTIAGQANQTYTSVAATGGTGTGARFNVTRNGSGAVLLTGITVAASGSGYTNGDSLTIAGATVGGGGPLYAFTNATFTSGGTNGRNGPSVGTAQTGLSGTPAPSTWYSAFFTVTSGIQYWTVPTSGTYTITAQGAQGGIAGGQPGGRATSMRGDFTLIKGEIIAILVGQIGESGAHSQDGQPLAAGSGGTFVIRAPYNTNGSILVIAGGGGGAAGNSYSTMPGRSALTGTSGNTNANLTGAGTGGNGAPGVGTYGGPGAGFFGDGGIPTGTPTGDRAKAFVNGGTGGRNSRNNGGAEIYGGFGGGGGGGGLAAGGGGGYSGGSEGIWSTPQAGGGGGSYNSGTNQVNQQDAVTGPGFATIVFTGGSGGADNIVTTVSTAPTVIGGSTGSQDAFVAKYTTVGGVTWVSRIGAGGQGPVSVAVALDLSVNVTGGILNGTWTLYNAPGTSGTVGTVSPTKSCAYVAKWNSAGTGQWIQLITTSSNSPNYGLGIAVDGFANVFATGLMFGTTTFGGTRSFVVNGEDGYVAKYTPAGALAWVSQMDELASVNNAFAGGVSYDRRAGVLWTTGSFSNQTNFYNNNTTSYGLTLQALGGNLYDTFIVKYSA